MGLEVLNFISLIKTMRTRAGCIPVDREWDISSSAETSFSDTSANKQEE